ncbi:putative sensor histidine kinase/response regulator TcsB/Sln1 [Talaromyces proteolyticus]|uniref:histidine kinase n=1 Tax=Talaromyces proteolyticus TaxID=1131652 RepID=A0AAD4PWL7_9EURO|nr:putative sensor histidine kinase/response regulator TcsB/Sln1 [Talaromyces proteolyticus]KAH8695230.1 putative sensor histidine kinase/response regulator TcsB/Sln1 [Talaromyces proteolyticus]
MRVPIALQLALLVLITSLVGLAVISIATWKNNYHFVTSIKSQGLVLTASLKAGQIASDLQLIESTCATVSTRVLIQNSLRRFYQGNTSYENWANAIIDLQSALGTSGIAPLYQAKIFSRNGVGDSGGLLNVTSDAGASIALPYTYANGSSVMLGDPGLGYPPSLYPNITYTFANGVDPANATSNDGTASAFPNYIFNATSALLLGPISMNSTLSLLSFTLPIINNTSNTDILGYMTIVASATSLLSTLVSRDFIDSTALVLLIGPADQSNLFLGDVRPAEDNEPAANVTDLTNALAHYVFMPPVTEGESDRHDQYRNNDAPFKLSSYPQVLGVLSNPKPTANNSTSSLATTNEQGYEVAVGVARPQTNVVDWVVIMEETHAQAFASVVQLRNIILACVFGTAGFITLIVFPLAHYSVTPIRKLKAATEKAIQPGPEHPYGSALSVNHSANDDGNDADERDISKSNFLTELKKFLSGKWYSSQLSESEEGHRRPFKVPLKVKESKHCVTDELTELTGTFNEMSDELMIQYTRLEERVAERTRELEISKRAAEAANESKTHFIANISHELKTPLNGILGMCAVCMGEEDLSRIKKSLKVVYKSGDLLLHLLNDLLTFSKNEIEQAVRLDEKDFNLADIKSQILTIFERQFHEKRVDFSVKFIGTSIGEVPLHESLLSEKQPVVAVSPAFGPPGTGRMKDMVLWGDHHRILQILINLVSNSLKFTPEGGSVEVRIRCVGDYEKSRDVGGKVSFDSKHSSGVKERTSSARSREIEPGQPSGTILQDNIKERENSIIYRTLEFAFEVQDTGPGIPPHLLQRVFEPFVQGDLGLNRKFGGTGLGLSICSQLSRLMSGTIALDSTVGKGSTFTVKIPLKFVKEMASSTHSSSDTSSRPQSKVFLVDDPNSRPDTPSKKSNESQDLQPRLVGLSQPFFAAAPPPTSQPTSSVPGSINTSDSKTQAMSTITPVSSTKSGRTRVLVADDNAVNQEVVLRMLKLEDIYDVTIAKDGQEAYDTVKAAMSEGNQFDLIFMDIQMPNVDGLQSTRLIREMGYSAPIVALSAFAEESNIKDCMESGMDMFLSKPIRRPALKQVLQKFATIEEEEGELATP